MLHLQAPRPVYKNCSLVLYSTRRSAFFEPPPLRDPYSEAG